MTRKELDEIKLTKKWPFKIMHIFKSYFIVIFPVGFLLIAISTINSGFENDINDLKIMGFTFLLLGIVSTIFIIKKLYENHIFKTYKIDNLTNDKIEEIIKFYGYKNYEKNKMGYYQIVTNVSWFSWGEIITIIPKGNELLINSKPKDQPFTIFEDKKNIKKIIKKLNE